MVKILFTAPKANLIAELLDDRNCCIKELIFDKCRARPDKMKIIFSALARNKSIQNLSMSNMNITKESIGALFESISSA